MPLTGLIVAVYHTFLLMSIMFIYIFSISKMRKGKPIYRYGKKKNAQLGAFFSAMAALLPSGSAGS
jgi:hypothetical protein